MGGPRDYSDVKAGTWAHEAAEYCKAGEVKSVSKAGHEIATFGGGCFWGVELIYQRMPGVIGTAVGYAQGSVEHPSYEAVCSGTTGHTEVGFPVWSFGGKVLGVAPPRTHTCDGSAWCVVSAMQPAFRRPAGVCVHVCFGRRWKTSDKQHRQANKHSTAQHNSKQNHAKHKNP